MSTNSDYYDQYQQHEVSNVKRRETTGFRHKSCRIVDRLDGKLAIVTGANAGIGKYIASELARRGARVIMACRSYERAKQARDEIVATYGEENPDFATTDVADASVSRAINPVRGEQLIIEELDLGSMQSIRRFADRIKQQFHRVDYLINNAGVVETKYSKTVDGFEKTVGVNHLGPFLLTELLLPLVKAAAPSRIVITASIAQLFGTLYRPDLQPSEKAFKQFKVYSSSKLLNVMHARELARRLEGTGVIVASVHPGTVKTQLLLVVEQIDLASLESIRAFADRIRQKYDKIDFLINNAGLTEPNYVKTVDGFEKTVGVNHLGHFLLTELLLPLIKAAAPSRIIIVSSSFHRFGVLPRPDLQLSQRDHGFFESYNTSKLLNILHARELAKRLEGSDVVVASLHPGVVVSEIRRNLEGWVQRTVSWYLDMISIPTWTGAQTSIYCALSKNIKSGAYYSNCALTSPQSNAITDVNCKWVYERSTELVKISNENEHNDLDEQPGI